MAAERDYVLGTHEEELARLGLQHRVWRSVVLDCWQRAGITVAKRVLDIGAGPGYAATDRKTWRRYARRQRRYFSRIRSLRDVAIFSAIIDARTFPRARDRDMARIWRRTRWRAPITWPAWREWFRDSLREAAYLLPAPERLHVAMACHIHRDLPRTPARNGANRSQVC